LTMIQYVFPLIYLLLRRHLKVITLACKHVLDVEEFAALNDSLVSILLAIDYRVRNVEGIYAYNSSCCAHSNNMVAIFKQTHLDVQARLGNFAFGMVSASRQSCRFNRDALDSFNSLMVISKESQLTIRLGHGQLRMVILVMP
jgi:hypothetical protein